MKKRLTAMLLALCLVASIVPWADGAMISADDYDDVEYWDGTVDTSWYNSSLKNITLYTGAQLAGLATIVQSGKDTFDGKTIRLGADIVLNDFVLDDNGQLITEDLNQWLPIGCYRNGWQPFSGTFDGRGHVISGLYDNSTTAYNDDKNHGLFGYTHSAEIKNLTLVDSYIYAYDYAGAIVGNAYSSRIVNCAAYASVGGPVHVGGIAGAAAMNTEIVNCFAAGSVTSNRYVGGVAGYMDGTACMENCYSASEVIINDGAFENYGGSIPNGGIVGVADDGAEIFNCRYLAGTAGSAFGSGDGDAAIMYDNDLLQGDILWELDRWASREDGLNSWTEIDGWPFVDGADRTLSVYHYIQLVYSDSSEFSGLSYTWNFCADPDLYYIGQFVDVNENEWYGAYDQGCIQMAVCLGIMNGYSDGTFLPDNQLKLCEAIKMALMVYDIYHYGQAQEYEMGAIWYQQIVASAVEKGIIREGDFVDYEASATRCEMAYIFANALPESEFAQINDVYILPDVTADTEYSESVFMLYRAGILTGNDSEGTFTPYQTISRAQAAAIIARLAVVSMRVAR